MNNPHVGTSLQWLSGELPLRGVVFYLRGAPPEWALLEVVGDAEAVLGRSTSALSEDPLLWVERLHPDDRARVLDTLTRIEPGTDRTLEYRVLEPDGRPCWVRDTVRRSGRRPGATVGLLRNVDAERELRDQVSSLEERIWKMQRMGALGSLAAGVAHDFNNLLTTILSSVQLVEEDEDISPVGRADLDLIRETARRGSRLVRQILRFAARGEEVDTDEVDLGRNLEDLRGILDRTVGVDIDLRLRVAPELPCVQCDAAQIEQVILNLVVNARDAMPDGGTIEVGVDREVLDEERRLGGGLLHAGEYVLLTVRDTGQGIPEDAVDRIFEPFFTTKTEKSSSGTGFGLATVQRIVRGYGGTVTVDSEEGVGTTFTVWLPVREASGGALPEIAVPGRDQASGMRALVVEDDPQVREVVARTLGRAGHEVLAVSNATEAVRIFDRAKPRPDVAIVDVVLPDRSGPELVRALSRRVPHFPVVFISGYGQESLTVRGGEGEEIFVPKPFSQDELLDAVTEAYERFVRRSDESLGSVPRSEPSEREGA